MQKWEWFAVALIINPALSAILTFFTTGLKVYGLAEGGGTYNLGYLTVLGWVIALLMNFYTFWRKFATRFVITIAAGWIMPIIKQSISSCYYSSSYFFL